MSVSAYRRGLHGWSILLAVCTLLLVVAGGLVTSRDAGLSVPDWPLSYGKLMPPMEGGIFYEHGHRMIATMVGIFTIVSLVWIWMVDRRPWMRWLGVGALLAVIAQGTLGGLTVIYLLPWWISTSHATLAQLFFSTTVAMAVFTSPWWLAGATIEAELRKKPILGLSTRGSDLRSGPIGVGCGCAAQSYRLDLPHLRLAHRGGRDPVPRLSHCTALLGNRELRLGALTLIGITFTQIFLGIAAYMSRIAYADAVQPMPLMVTFTVFHVAVGALTLASSVVLAILVRRNITHAPLL